VIKYFLIAIVSIGFITCCSSVSVTNDYDPEADFLAYSTFSIYDGVIKDS